METWRSSWRKAIAPQLNDDELSQLRVAVETDDKNLIQGSTTQPPPLMCVSDWPVEGGCLFGFCGVIRCGGFGNAKVGEVEEEFAAMCCKADELLGEMAGVRHFLNWFDDTPRAVVLQNLLSEIVLEQAERKGRAEG